MNNSIALKILDKFADFFRLIRVDYEAMRLILSFKLTMDKRKIPTIMQDGKNKEDALFSPMVKSLLLYAFYGLFLIVFLVMGDNYFFQMSLVFAIMMFILMTAMIADFSTVLLDVRDKAILDTKPIDARTISVAKLMHVLIYITQLTGAFLAIPFVVSAIVNGFGFALLFLVSIIFVAIFSVVATALFYMVILKFFDGERLRNLINSIQVLLTIGIFVGYQLIARSFDFIDRSFSIEWQWWHTLLPPMWFSGPFEMFLLGNYADYIIVFSVLALTVPIMALLLYFYLMPTFERNLQKLLASSKTRKPKRTGLENLVAKMICSTKEERAMFQFASKLLRREREFKLKVYPALGMSIVFPFIMMFNLQTPDGTADYSYSYLFAYFSILMVPTVVHMLKYSNKHGGAWIYQVVPVRDLTIFYRATLKAFLIQLFVPLTILMAIVFTITAGVEQIPHFVIIILIGCLFTIICYRFLNNQRYPFASPFSFAESANTAFMFLSMFLIGGVTLLHFLIQLIPYGVYGYMIILLVANLIAWKTVFKNKA